ncbi:M14 family zinc carboxypeptidase [Aquimarina intermedia]|uniref:Zinc carboxypeptidase n=1 Tax=Aquimarina intermedia TaxID=350814 RepID=A0A5S5C9J7_9FLAO|nr:M14 family zinc carboxypeptidase [Aquimarina intermedia]TYP75010.1 zinc carboxypeptidase [Aquimarina intermedia]
MNITELKNLWIQYQNQTVFGRYLPSQTVAEQLQFLKIPHDVVGYSESETPIHLLKFGVGKRKILMWSQMHGNESTTTKAVFDLVTMLMDASCEVTQSILSNCTLYIIPMLNPDGADAYTRVNANQVDLNRDAQERTQKESLVLRSIIDTVKPDFAFNLHDQRTIFSAGPNNHSAVVSFLSPAGDAERSITKSRVQSMQVISAMNELLQQLIPNQIGRYDDSFNINCIGDTLEHEGIPTILFEAGHYKEDYDREKTRSFIFYALVKGLTAISSNTFTANDHKEYLAIPENEKRFYDIIIREVSLKGQIKDIALQFTEKLSDTTIIFVPKIAAVGDLSNFYGHREIKGAKRAIRHYNDVVEVVPEVEMLKFYLNTELFSV